MNPESNNLADHGTESCVPQSSSGRSMVSQGRADTSSEQSDDSTDLEKLPLWRSLAVKMIRDGVDYGSSYSTTFFEDGLREKRDSMGFAWGVHEIRKVLEKHGFYLTARGQKGEQFVILPAEANADVMHAYARKAADALRRGVILGTQTPLSILKAEDRRRHEAMLEKLATKAVLLRRSDQISKVVKLTHSELLPEVKAREVR